MPWWGWTLIGLVVWVSLLYWGAQLLLARKVMKLHEQMMTDGPKRLRDMGTLTDWPVTADDLPGDAFAPRHRKQP